MSSQLDDGIWCDEMQCHVVGSEQKHQTEITYYLAYMNAPDMNGTIRRTLRASPMVTNINVIAPKKDKHKYEKIGEKWFSFHAPKCP